MKTIQAKLSDAVSSYALRCDANYLLYMKQDFVSRFPSTKFTKLRSVIKSMHNGANVDKEAYSAEPTNYVYLSVTAIKKTGILWDKTIYLTEDKGRELEGIRLRDQQVILGRSGTYVGLAAVFDEKESKGRVVIPSGYTIIVDIDIENAYPKFVVGYLNSSYVQQHLITVSTEKNQRNLSQRYLANVPFPSVNKDQQKPIVAEIEKLEERRRLLTAEIANVNAEENQLFWKA